MRPEPSVAPNGLFGASKPQQKNPFDNETPNISFPAAVPNTAFPGVAPKTPTESTIEPPSVGTPIGFQGSVSEYVPPEPRIASMEKAEAPTAEDIMTARLSAFSVESVGCLNCGGHH